MVVPRLSKMSELGPSQAAMYGFIHCALEDLVTKKFGADTWKLILEKSGITMHGASFLMHKVYTDEMTLKLVAAACEVLGLDLDTCLEAFGEHFLYFCQQHGYDHILRVLGSNMADFLTNLDNLHDHLASTYPGMRAPSFRVTPGPSGQILLHYYSDRKGLHPIVLGIVKVVGREFFNTEVRANISVVSEFGDRAHVTMEVTEQNKEGKSCLLPSNASETLSNCPEDLPMGVFVVQTKEGVLRPRGSNKSEVDGGDSSSPPVLRLKGQMVSVEETQSILFLCSPRVKDIDDMRRIGLFFSDLAIHDPARELFLRSHHHRGERELIEKLDEATNRLKMLQSKLDEDKKRTEELLHSILPSKVAMRLCQNLPVEAEKFETVSCLFSDIVGFTNMCGSCAPMDIVRLLNKLYLQFDNLSNVHGVYKVETIGDAYVVVAGVPDFVEDHADRLVAMGLDMITATKSVLNPVSGEPIQMRIGVHTGYATAGVVGKTMPRYCLFGNTVTLANKTESLSKPSRVNVTEVARSHLTKKDYVFEDNLDVGDFPLRCYLVDMSSRPNAEAQPTAAGEQPADDSMLLSPSSSPVRRSSAVTSPSFDVDEIGLFIKSRLNCTDANVDGTGAQQRKKNDDESLLAALHEATYSQVHQDTTDSGNVTAAESLQTPPVPPAASTTGLTEDAAARHSALSSTERRGSSSLGIETDASKPPSGSKSSFFGFTWSLPQGSKQKKTDTHSSRSASPQAIRENRGDCAGKAYAMESVGSDAGRQHCPFFRFRSKGAGRQEELADSGRCSQTAEGEVAPTDRTEGRVSGGQQDRAPNSPSTSHRGADVRRKEKFWSRVVFPS
ncbi:hypothetical protein HPB49_025028 [Dermacentor silvarum]|uniref:Uncharacterized protein n=1 Tax=Dermacentor silvarum TaxID=543639 RepID=A0ACB8D135_DERSI|nr:hypothetical protein HPB49_025028 [Dermacentor silvarum]